MAVKKKKTTREPGHLLPVRSSGKRAEWPQIKELVIWLHEHTGGDSEVAMDMALAAARGVCMTSGGLPEELDQRYEEVRQAITIQVPMATGGNA